MSQLPKLQSRILFCGFFDGAINGLSGLAVIFSSASCMLKMRLCNGILWKTPLHWSSGCHLVSSFVFFSKKEKKKKLVKNRYYLFPILSKYSILFCLISEINHRVISIQRRDAELNIILPRVHNFNIKEKKAWNICFIICHKDQTRSGKVKANKAQQILVKI